MTIKPNIMLVQKRGLSIHERQHEEEEEKKGQRRNVR